MATLPERLTVVEVLLDVVRSDVSTTRVHVETLLGWQAEERGARKQRAFTVRQLGIGFTIVTVAINLVFKVLG